MRESESFEIWAGGSKKHTEEQVVRLADIDRRSIGEGVDETVKLATADQNGRRLPDLALAQPVRELKDDAPNLAAGVVLVDETQAVKGMPEDAPAEVREIVRYLTREQSLPPGERNLVVGLHPQQRRIRVAMLKLHPVRLTQFPACPEAGTHVPWQP